jgi:hypothetical protein
MPFCDLCNRLDVTSTHQSSDSRAWCLRTRDRRFTRRPLPRARLRAPDTTRSTSTPELRCRKPRPQVMLQLGAAVTSYDPRRPLHGGRSPLSEAATRARLLGHARAGRQSR